MREKIIIVLLFVLTVFISIFPVLGQERIKEEVKVVSVEVPVRVFYKGDPVDHLTIDDFKLYENKKKQVINSLNIVRKKLKADHNKPRHFVFLFRTYNYNEQFKDGFRYIFENILNENDTLMALVNNKSMMIDRLNNKEEALARLENLIIEQAQSERGRLNSYLKRIEQQIDMRKMASSPQLTHFVAIQNFLKKYLSIWKDYKLKYLLPNLGRYYHLCSQLESIKREKWVINFYQMEMLPNIIIPGEMKRGLHRFTDNMLQSARAEDVSYGRILRTLLNEVEEQTNIALDFPVEEICKMLYKVDTTFHTIFSRTSIGVESRDHESMEIISDMGKCIGEITTSTGGMLVSSNDVKSAFGKIVEKEDVYYLLTYAPKNPKETGKLKIKTNKKYKVLYDDNMRADYIKEYVREINKKPISLPAVSIKELDLKSNNLCVSICDFLLKKSETGAAGHIDIHIRVESVDGKVVFDQGKTLTTQNDVFSISIPFKHLKKGKYVFIVYVRDRSTGKADNRRIEKKL